MKNIIKNSKAEGKAKVIDFGYLTSPIELLYEQFQTSLSGLSQEEAEERIDQYGYNEPAKRKKSSILWQIFSKFLNPLVIVLIIIGIFSLFFGQQIDALFVLMMVILSVGLSFTQEYRSGKEAERLSEMVKVTATVYRDSRQEEIKIRDIVPGDVVYLSAGDIIPADLRVISCKDLFVNQASLTGESFPVEKFSETDKVSSKNIMDFQNILFMGSSVVSGTGLALVIATGQNTKFGEVSKRLTALNIETNFDKGIKKFTWLMIKFMVVLVCLIFSINFLMKVTFVEALLFALAVAVGLTPEMLPMLVTINLSKGAIAMSKKKVIVRRLNSIQNFGAMDVLCTDKTGTLTLDQIVLEKYCDIFGNTNEDVLRYAYLNSYHQTGLKNLLDLAILRHKELNVESYVKVDEMPFDFQRRVMSVVVEKDGIQSIITKGAPEEIFKRCRRCLIDNEIISMQPLFMPELKEQVEELSRQGFRVLAIAYRDEENSKFVYSKEDEDDLILCGYVAFLDPPKPTVKAALKALKELKIDLKVVTGDNELVTRKICSDLGIDTHNIVTGAMVEGQTDDELKSTVEKSHIFARLNPLQKERIVTALHDCGHTVGFMGDGINDAPALKASDVGISVNNAVDIAKESADLVLLEKNLMVLEEGVVEGRKTFGNIVKYIKMGASSNFGNMFSMTGASFLLPFLPMMPIQILLNNLLYDFSQTAIPTDEVDKEYLLAPRPWNIDMIKKFMMWIGPVSSIFDYMTFGLMYFIFGANSPDKQRLFQTGWFIESLCSQTLVIHIIRTNRIPFIESRPSKFLVLSSLLIVGLGIFIANSSFASYFYFVRLPLSYYGYLAIILCCYLCLVHFVKSRFVRKYGQD